MPITSGGNHPLNRAISRRRLLQFGLPALGLGLADILCAGSSPVMPPLPRLGAGGR